MQHVLDGRQSKILVMDYKVGNTKLLYSSADISTYGLFPSSAIAMYLKEGQTGEFAMGFDPIVVSFNTFGAKSHFDATRQHVDADGVEIFTVSLDPTKGQDGSTVLQWSNCVFAGCVDRLGVLRADDHVQSQP